MTDFSQTLTELVRRSIYQTAAPAANSRCFPKNWKTSKANVKIRWYNQHRFYDPGFSGDPKTKGVKQRILKGMNRHKDLRTRQSVTKASLENEMELLITQAYNPFANTFKN